MKQNVFILRAGFSRAAGYPLISDFKEKMIEAREWLEDQGRTHELESVKKVLEFRENAGKACEYVNFEPNNIEHLFSLASAQDLTTMSHIQRAIAATLSYSDYVYRKACPAYALTTIANPGEKSPEGFMDTTVASIYGHFVRLLVGRLTTNTVKNSVITFNYDLLLEDALSEDRSLIFDDIDFRDLEILKLHGSINWVQQPERSFVEGSVHALEYVGYEGLWRNNETPLLIPPTWNKVLTDERLRDSWNLALRALKNADRIFIIGFSFPPTDYHFRFLLAAGLMGNYKLKGIEIIDPNVSSLANNVEALFTKPTIAMTRYHGGGFETFMTDSEKIVAAGLADRRYNFNQTGKYITKSL